VVMEVDSVQVVDSAVEVDVEPGQLVTSGPQEMMVWVVVSVIVEVMVWARGWRANALRPRRRVDFRILR
jgi:hypothetical protein